jgi:RNA 2',3'-cyclic 3'-phosphodiesterase
LTGLDEEPAGGAERPREPARRVFFALWPDEVLRTAFAQAIRKALRACGGRPVPTQSLHVTLAFLGSVLERRIPELTSVARRVADAFAADGTPLQLVFDRVEHWKKAQIVCATVGADSPSAVATIGSLAEMLKRESASAGFAPDLKPFRAHVTVARKVARTTRSLDMHSVLWSCTEFALVESRTEAAGAVYSVVESWPLVRTQNA